MLDGVAGEAEESLCRRAHPDAAIASSNNRCDPTRDPTFCDRHEALVLYPREAGRRRRPEITIRVFIGMLAPVSGPTRVKRPLRNRISCDCSVAIQRLPSRVSRRTMSRLLVRPGLFVVLKTVKRTPSNRTSPSYVAAQM